MKRFIDSTLLEWKDSANRKPLVIRGARQVGKSYAVRALGKTFEHFIELNFDRSPELSRFFQESLDPNTIIPKIEAVSSKKVTSGSTLIFLDEIQRCPEALTALRYFYEERPELHVIAAGSLLEFAIEKVGFPVGRVRSMHMHPMSFKEFLGARGFGEVRIKALEVHDIEQPIGEPLHALCLSAFREYMAVGGMPEAVQSWVSNQSILDVNRIHQDLLQTYRDDFGKYSKTREIPHVEKVFSAVPLQFGAKFKFSNVDSLIKSRELKNALVLLARAGLLHLVHHTEGTGIPLGGEVDLRDFKVIFVDVGLAQALLGGHMGAAANHWITKGDLSASHVGNLAEVFVGQELVASIDPFEQPRIFYWRRNAKNSSAEIDYLVQHSGRILPIEVKSGAIGRLKSLKMFLQLRPQCKVGYRILEHDFSLREGIQSVPLYAVWRIFG